MSVLAEPVLALLALALCLASAGGEPAQVTVPPELLARTSMPELSGIAWSPALSRYLVISDDTGDKQQGTNHAPWLFTMSRDGALDPSPLPIAGLDKLNDAEGLCAGPDGSYFLATSHSQNRKGHDKAERRRLFHLTLAGRELRILGTLDLATAIAESGTVPPGGVDIEALAFRAGALYVGLKAPQTPAGEALILRVRDVLPALQTGSLGPGRIERFAAVPLRVPSLAAGSASAAGPASPAGPAATVVQGVSDMSFLPDGSMALLANSPKNMPVDGGGTAQ